MNPEKIVNLHPQPNQDAEYTQSWKAQLGEEYRLISVPKITLADPIIEWLVKTSCDSEGVIPKKTTNLQL